MKRRTFLTWLTGLPLVMKSFAFPWLKAKTDTKIDKGLRVLIVDDHESPRIGMAEIIAGWGYIVETAKDGMEGLEKAVSFSPSILLTDIRMPRVDGMLLLEHLSARRPEIAVVMVTAHPTTEGIVTAMKLGAYDYIEKPVNAERLRKVLENASILQGIRAQLKMRDRNLLL